MGEGLVYYDEMAEWTEEQHQYMLRRANERRKKMSQIEQMSEGYDYDPFLYDRERHNQHHVELVRSLEKAPEPILPKSGPAVFSEQEVLEIRKLCAEGVYSQEEIGAAYGVSGVTICKIATGQTYTNIGGPRTRRGSNAGPMPPNRAKRGKDGHATLNGKGLS